MLRWGQISQIGRYTIRPVRTLGLDMFGIFVGDKLKATHHSENAMISTAHRLDIRDNQAQSNQEILDIVNDCEHITTQLRKNIDVQF
jgi:hypothetical protein